MASIHPRRLHAELADQFDTNAMASESTLMDPRFYTTDFDEMDRVDVTPVRKDWDELLDQMRSDPNKGHFKKNEDWDEIDWDGMDPKLRAEFIDFLVSSCTSGSPVCKETSRGSNQDICELFSFMARDEARHAGFINDALREAGVAAMGFLTRAKKYTYFTPKFIYYATFSPRRSAMRVSRSIVIRGEPRSASHPIFKWFKEWCNDEFSHGVPLRC